MIDDHDLQFQRAVAKLPSVKADIDHRCFVPNSTIDIDYKGRVFHCNCAGFVPFTSGHLADFPTIDSVLNSSFVNKLKNTINDKTFYYCNTASCGIANSDRYPDSNYRNFLTKSRCDNMISIKIGIDDSCNLSCPSCREEKRFYTSDSYTSERNQWVDHIMGWIARSDRMFDISVGGAGEPFASPTYLYLLGKLATVENVQIHIMTNGHFAKRALTAYPELLQKLVNVCISIDAGSREVFEVTRRGGNWDLLLENLQYFKDMGVRSISNYVIQKSNYKDIEKFLDLCNRYELIPNFGFVGDWGSWADYTAQCVHISDSPYFDEFRYILKNLPNHRALDGVRKQVNA